MDHNDMILDGLRCQIGIEPFKDLNAAKEALKNLGYRDYFMTEKRGEILRELRTSSPHLFVKPVIAAPSEVENLNGGKSISADFKNWLGSNFDPNMRATDLARFQRQFEAAQQEKANTPSANRDAFVREMAAKYNGDLSLMTLQQRAQLATLSDDRKEATSDRKSQLEAKKKSLLESNQKVGANVLSHRQSMLQDIEAELKTLS